MRAAHILVVDDEADIRHLIQEILSEEGYDVAVAADATAARAAVAERSPELVLLDIWMPDMDGISLLREWQQNQHPRCPVVMLSGHGTIETAVEATRLGAADFLEKPLSLNVLLRTVSRALEGQRSAARASARAPVPPVFAALGRSRRVSELRRQAEQLAAGTRPLLLVGESGTGRGALARFIHDHGPRRDQPFVKVAGAGLLADNAPQLLLGAESARGAEPGALERAGGGTLFISTLEDASPAAQALLLGVLETGSYARLGRATPVPAAARFIVSVQPATLAAPEAAGLRADLLNRCGDTRIGVPALREYSGDISELLRHMVEDLTERQQLPFRRFGLPAQNRLRNYPWPGNLRELSGLVERLLAAAGSEEIGLAEVEAELARTPGGAARQPLVQQDLLALPLREAREQFERAYLTEQLALCGGKVGALARRVGMERTHLYRKLRALGVEFRASLADE